MMALIKEPYGLVRNTDGTLCTTYRDDVVPFRGVRSFAVETATTNLFTNPRLLNNGSGWRPYSLTAWVDSSGEYPYIHCEAQFAGVYQTLSLSATTYTLSYLVKHKSGSNRIGSHFDGNKPTLKIRIDGGERINGDLITVPSDGNWHLVEIQATYKTAGSYKVYLQPGRGVTGVSEFYFKYAQIEQKPFATSFVDGSRPKGRLVISVEDLKFDIANDDWVISYWKYPVATIDDTQNERNTCSLGRWTSDFSKGYIWWGKETHKNKYRLRVVLNDATPFENISDNTFNPTDYFYHWHYEVVKKSGKVLSYYVDGVKQCEVIIPADKELQTPFDVGLSLGGYTSDIFYPANTLIAALYYGYNSATWTDEYIQEM